MATETPAYLEGYDACYDGMTKGQCHYSQASDEYGEWVRGFDAALREIRQDIDCANLDADQHASTYD